MVSDSKWEISASNTLKNIKINLIAQWAAPQYSVRKPQLINGNESYAYAYGSYPSTDVTVYVAFIIPFNLSFHTVL